MRFMPPSLAASFESFSKHPNVIIFVWGMKDYCLEIVSLVLLFVCFEFFLFYKNYYLHIEYPIVQQERYLSLEQQFLASLAVDLVD